MGRTYKDKPDQYRTPKEKRKPREGRRFESSKGRKDRPLKELIRDGRSLEDYFI